jgi:hypothetical protein
MWYIIHHYRVFISVTATTELLEAPDTDTNSQHFGPLHECMTECATTINTKVAIAISYKVQIP